MGKGARVRSRSWLGFAALVLLAGCIQGGPPPNFTAAARPAIAAGMARLYFYRDLEPYESLTRPWISLNGEEVALSEPGGVSYRDVPPGRYLISVLSPGLYPHQFKSVALKAGDTGYAKIESLSNWQRALRWGQDTFVVVLVDENQAQLELPRMRLVSGLP